MCSRPNENKRSSGSQAGTYSLSNRGSPWQVNALTSVTQHIPLRLVAAYFHWSIKISLLQSKLTPLPMVWAAVEETGWGTGGSGGGGSGGSGGGGNGDSAQDALKTLRPLVSAA